MWQQDEDEEEEELVASAHPLDRWNLYQKW